MANSLTSNPWRLDTASTTAVLSTNRLRINRIRWTTPTAADTLVIKDQLGVTKISVRADSTADIDVYDAANEPGEDWNGLILHTMAHGVCEIVYK